LGASRKMRGLLKEAYNAFGGVRLKNHSNLNLSLLDYVPELLIDPFCFTVFVAHVVYQVGTKLIDSLNRK